MRSLAPGHLQLHRRLHPHLHRIRSLRLAREVALVTLGIVVYFGVRGLTVGDPAQARAHAAQVFALERVLGLDHELGVQRLLVHHDHVAAVANWVYIFGHWPVIVTVLLWLALQHPVHYLLLRDGMLLSGAAGLVVFALYPVAPPRLARSEIVDTVTEQSHAYRVLQPPAFVNQYAAMPSLHVGWDLLVGLTVAAAAAHGCLRLLGRLLPALMAVAVVLTGNHYLLDVVAGVLLALAGLLLADRLRTRRLYAHRAKVERARREPVGGEPVGGEPVRGAHPRAGEVGAPRALAGRGGRS